MGDLGDSWCLDLRQLRSGLLVLLAACGASGPPMQGTVSGDIIECGADCTGALRGYFAQHPETRIAGVVQILGAPTPQLIAWASDSDAWPAARDLSIDTIACDVTPGVPDCAAAITEMIRLAPGAKHAFLVPLVGTTPRMGSWTLLDLRRTSGSSGSWSKLRAVALPCRIERGDIWYKDEGLGVMEATGKKVSFSAETPDLCDGALISYLRANPDERIAGVLTIAGTPARTTDDQFPGTASMVILVGDPAWPRADSLAVSTVYCNEPTCARMLAELHAALKPRRTLFTAPVTLTAEHATRTHELIVVSKLP